MIFFTFLPQKNETCAASQVTTAITERRILRRRFLSKIVPQYSNPRWVPNRVDSFGLIKSQSEINIHSALSHLSDKEK